MRSRRFLLLLLLFVSLDFAVPYEPTARGWQDFEDEEESVHPEGRRLDRPRATSAKPATGAAALSTPRRVATRQPSRQAEVPVTRLARADTSSSPPPATPEAH